MLGDFKWHRRYMDMAKLVASWSKDPRKQVGCVLTDELNRIVATGYNGPPRGLDSFKASDRLEVTIHAELNAILTSDREFVTCYTWPVLPCHACMAALAQSGVQRVVSLQEPSAKWRWDISQQICDTLGIEVITL